MLITDPRYFEWLFMIENEIRQHTPIIYLNIWDDYPAPLYNKAFYESCDALLAISKQTKLINELVLGEKAKNKVIHYVPHGLNHEMYYPIEKEEELKELEEFKKLLFRDKEKDFVVFFNSRNIRRKQIPDTMLAFKIFLDTLPKEKAAKCAMVMHTEVVIDHGTDLEAVRKILFHDYPDAIYFSLNKLDNKQFADVVLVDAPCSGLGTLTKKPEIKWKREIDFEVEEGFALLPLGQRRPSLLQRLIPGMAGAAAVANWTSVSARAKPCLPTAKFPESRPCPALIAPPMTGSPRSSQRRRMWCRRRSTPKRM
jgi:glycosyltransferase involved in cell wall biosynthesis